MYLRRSGSWFTAIIAVFLIFADFLVAEDDSVRRSTVQKATAYFLENQAQSGAWSDEKYPALTAFVLWGLAGSGLDPQSDAVIRATDYLLSSQIDGGIYEGAIYVPAFGQKGSGLPNYNTAVSISALSYVDDPRVAPAILRARAFLARSQYLGDSDPLFKGGMGYDPPAERPYADMSNSYLGYEGMHMTRRYEDMRGSGSETVDIDWQAAAGFLTRCHNDSDINSLPWASSDKSEKGGFAYRPDEFRPTSGAYTNTQGVLTFRSMPGMTYAGLLSYRYAGVGLNDPRVKAALQWTFENFQLERGNRNPDVAGTDKEGEGLFYMYAVLAKALSAYEIEDITLPNGKRVNWRSALANRLAGVQNADGSFVNPTSRYWEGNPILATAYALIALNYAAPQPVK